MRSKIGMPRKRLVRQSLFPYSVTARSNNRDWFEIPLEKCWKIFEQVIIETTEKYGFQTHCFVLMANHFHWLLSTPNENLDEGMRYFMTETSRRLARASKRINKIYGARYKPTMIELPEYYANTVRYFYQNPVRAGVTKRVEDYQWSTCQRVSKIELVPKPAFEEFIPSSPVDRLDWFNTLPDSAFNDCMRKALRRREFKYPRHPLSKKMIDARIFLNRGPL
ncbi:MAG: hypothetical protein EOP06_03645 [Proteobacteria bacterium]|nr:MAG: hypothetical protein EOP06_03645 [Pseudomonadota bacterium]